MTRTVASPTFRDTLPFFLLCYPLMAIGDFCCSTYSPGPPERRFTNWEICGPIIEYSLEGGGRHCLHSSDLKTDVQNLTKYIPRKTVIEKVHLSCKESLLYVDAQGQIQCVEERCSEG